MSNFNVWKLALIKVWVFGRISHNVDEKSQFCKISQKRYQILQWLLKLAEIYVLYMIHDNFGFGLLKISINGGFSDILKEQKWRLSWFFRYGIAQNNQFRN